MNEVRPLAEIASYHAHIYYDGQAERQHAEWLRLRIGERFRVRPGNWRDEPVGRMSRPCTRSPSPMRFSLRWFHG